MVGKAALRLGLGTAQFGLDYGISNELGQVTPGESIEILALAQRARIRVLDTAPGYGDSEEVLGRSLPADHGFSIVTKVPRIPVGLGPAAVAPWVIETFDRSLRRLGAGQAYGLLVHHAADLLEPTGADVWAVLEALRGSGAVSKIGVSVYDAAEIDALVDRYPLEIVQLPLNVLDQRLARSGHLERLKIAGIEVHARSVFLQGLLLMEPEGLGKHFDPAVGSLTAFRSAARSAGRSPLQAAVSYVLSLQEVDAAIFGVTHAHQLAQILSAAEMTLPRDWYAPFALEDEKILNPSLWPR